MTGDPFDHQVTAVVGVAKNCGKTTTLDFLLARATAARRVAGVVSVGIDGEPNDVLIGTPKPPVVVHQGQLVASTRVALENSTAGVEYIETLGFSTPLGEAVVARVLADGAVVLAGMRHRGDVRRAVDVMLEHGAQRVLIDGAYGRVMAADPTLADAVVVSTGAVVDTTIDGIVEHTAAVVDRLSLPAIEEPWQRELMQRAIAGDETLLGGPATAPVSLSSPSALVGLPMSRELWTPEIEAVAICGLVSNRVVHELLRQKPARVLLVPDGTVVQADPALVGRLRRVWEVRALHVSPVVAIAYNPTSVRGPGVRGEALAHAIAARWPKVPVFDPLVGIQ